MGQNSTKKKSWLVVIGADKAFSQLPFIFFLGALGVMYIWNAHLAERNLRQIQNLKEEVQEARWHFMSVRSDLMYSSTQTQVEGRVKKMNLSAQGEAPYVIR